ncbi:MAG: metallophosphoesterase, partial [Planctomycetia bacterium]|nr:metallophosphoesterase [Planctomycetia bacterium]
KTSIGTIPSSTVMTSLVRENAFSSSPEFRPTLRPLRILHLTDLHFGGGVPAGYYDRAIQTIQETLIDPYRPEFTAITGDFLDHDEWRRAMVVPLRRLAESPVREGVWFVLGNHDFRLKRTDADTLRRTLVEECGFHDLGGRIRTFRCGDGPEVTLIGDESPWGRTPPESMCEDIVPADHRWTFVLTHTPDRFPVWADRSDTEVDLVLAGHTHGGQMCVPGIGAILTPCVSGTTFSDGVFLRNGTFLHVGRGLAAQNPLRLFCPPEAVLLELRSTGSDHIHP